MFAPNRGMANSSAWSHRAISPCIAYRSASSAVAAALRTISSRTGCCAPKLKPLDVEWNEP